MALGADCVPVHARDRRRHGRRRALRLAGAACDVVGAAVGAMATTGPGEARLRAGPGRLRLLLPGPGGACRGRWRVVARRGGHRPHPRRPARLSTCGPGWSPGSANWGPTSDVLVGGARSRTPTCSRYRRDGFTGRQGVAVCSIGAARAREHGAGRAMATAARPHAAREQVAAARDRPPSVTAGRCDASIVVTQDMSRPPTSSPRRSRRHRRRGEPRPGGRAKQADVRWRWDCAGT